MNNGQKSSLLFRVGIRLLFVILAIAAVAWFVNDRRSWPRGEALAHALAPVVAKNATDESLAAKAILDNYREARANASRWSGIYWSCTFLAAGLSAFAGLILKFESTFSDDKFRKDIAAFSSVVAAVLITISTSGDFQRKWQANRIAAADLERAGYEFLQKNGANPRSYFATIAAILHTRHMSIVGGATQPSSVNAGEAAAESSP